MIYQNIVILTRTTFNKHFEIMYNGLTNAIKKTYSESDLFKKTIKSKLLSLKRLIQMQKRQ